MLKAPGCQSCWDSASTIDALENSGYLYAVSQFLSKTAALLFILMFARLGRAITLGQIDTFQDGTTQWWDGAQPQNIPNGGPQGNGDSFLQITSFGGTGSNSHLAAKNSAQWGGDYKAAGVTSIVANMCNFGSVTLEIRAVLFDFNNTRWTSTVSQNLAPGSGWQQKTFTLTQATMTRVQGTETFDFTSQNVLQLMFRHDAGSASSGGTSIASSMGIDNILAVPEPAAPAILLFGLLGLRTWKRGKS